MNSKNISIQLDKDKERFVVKLNGSEAFIDYEMLQDEVLDLKHTFVPEKHRGQNIANELAKYALDYARNNQLKIIPTCDFIKSFLEKNPGYLDLVKEETKR
jgi:predicted GNAT family acetyltransferase